MDANTFRRLFTLGNANCLYLFLTWIKQKNVHARLGKECTLIADLFALSIYKKQYNLAIIKLVVLVIGLIIFAVLLIVGWRSVVVFYISISALSALLSLMISTSIFLFCLSEQIAAVEYGVNSFLSAVSNFEQVLGKNVEDWQFDLNNEAQRKSVVILVLDKLGEMAVDVYEQAKNGEPISREKYLSEVDVCAKFESIQQLIPLLGKALDYFPEDYIEQPFDPGLDPHTQLT